MVITVWCFIFSPRFPCYERLRAECGLWVLVVLNVFQICGVLVQQPLLTTCQLGSVSWLCDEAEIVNDAAAGSLAAVT